MRLLLRVSSAIPMLHLPYVKRRLFFVVSYTGLEKKNREVADADVFSQLLSASSSKGKAQGTALRVGGEGLGEGEGGRQSL